MTRAAPVPRARRRTGRLVLVALLAAACYGDLTEPLDVQWTLVWEDQFDGPAGQLPDPARWGFDLGTDWGNGQLEYDTDRPENASLDGAGHLAIVARQQSFQGRSYTSARMTTLGRFTQREGRFEARIRIPTAAGIWPAFWLLGADCATVGWPRCGEIDIMENFGRDPSRTQGSLHGPGYSGANALTASYTLANDRFDADFHVFRIDWVDDRIDWYVDDQLYQVIKRSYLPGDWVFDRPFYLILNLAVGGGPAGSPAGTAFPQTMLVDWVRVYSAGK